MRHGRLLGSRLLLRSDRLLGLLSELLALLRVL